MNYRWFFEEWKKKKRSRVLWGALFVILVVFIGGLMLSTYTNPIPNKLAREKENTSQKIVNDVTELNPVKVVDIIVPHTIEEIADAVRNNDHVSIGGGRNSMGGQTASEKAVQIDMREYNQVLNFSPEKKEITVQAGIRWRDIQDYIDPSGLSVKIMQTYSNFTVGGSLSVNVHGRYVGLGPVILSVKKIRLVLANGNVVEATPSENSDLFYSAIGGMGGIGVISDVTLELAENVNVERSRKKIKTGDYFSFFKEHVRNSSNVLFHNGDMYPPSFESVSAVSWTVTNKEPTTEGKLIPRQKDYWKERIAWVVMSEWPKGRWIREHLIDPLVYAGSPPVHTRNYEASYDIAELEPVSRQGSTYVLQEYFVPVENFDAWVPKMKKVFKDNDVNILNVSIRHALADSGATLAWARKESFAFVVYYKQGTDEESKREVEKWTRKMIDQVLSVDGTYYLPYQIWASDDQFHRAYPGAVEYFEIKNKYDPTSKFTNKLWERYYSKEKLDYYKKKEEVTTLTKDIPEYTRAYDNAYLSIPEWYIVYSAEEYATALERKWPSQFGYFEAIGDYWRQYEQVTTLMRSSAHNNDDYIMVLRVIGGSFTAENMLKGVYENTVGRIFEKLSGEVKVPEDIYAAKVARDYGTFLYDYPWYDFPYLDSLKGLWRLSTDHDYSFGQNVRRIERKAFLSLEFGLKTLYSRVIAYFTHEKFGVQDDIIFAVVSHDGGVTKEVIQAPHYHPFTRLLLENMQKAEVVGEVFSVLDIAGNDKITFPYLDKSDTSPLPGITEILRDKEMCRTGEQCQRITIEVPIRELFSLYKSLQERGLTIEHFYDY